jgi:gamma-glutamylcyclotransferase (GGCT)/AIG2-like uncharacterized protein YtfP
MPCRLLFVYGSLKRGFELHHHLGRLGARFVSEARVAATLIARGRHPGAHPVVRQGKWVRGELFELQQAAGDLRVLDKIEGFIPAATARCEFVRATTEVVLPDGSRDSAWIYRLGARLLRVQLREGKQRA